MHFSMGFHNGVLSVKIQGKCTFSDYSYFQQIVDAVAGQPVESVNISLAQLEFIDSSGLGMLLMLNEKCNTKIILDGAHGQVRKMLEVAKLDQIFTVTG